MKAQLEHKVGKDDGMRADWVVISTSILVKWERLKYLRLN